MRLIQVLVPDDCRSDVLAVLDDEDIDYVLTREDGDDDDSAVVQFPVPTQAVDAVLTSLRDAGLDENGYTVVGSLETARTPNIQELEERFVRGRDEDDSIATEEIRTKALGMNPSPLTYYAMTVLSAIVATAGLLLNSPALVVGSMVIAPQMGSAMTTSGRTRPERPQHDTRRVVVAGARTRRGHRQRDDSGGRSSPRSSSHRPSTWRR
nr:hypothetical protein [Haladaptatus sp. R4]